MIRRLLAALFVLLPCAAYAQTPLLPGQLVEVTIPNPGQMQSGATTVLRPQANLIFEYRIDGAATPVPAVKAAACATVAPAPALACRLIPPVLPSGTHGLEIRVLVSPAEPGVNPSAYSASFPVAVILVSGPSTPINTRLVVPDGL